jgi:hypothetical protein
MLMMSELLEMASVALACRDPDSLRKSLSSRAELSLSEYEVKPEESESSAYSK